MKRGTRTTRDDLGGQRLSLGGYISKDDHGTVDEYLEALTRCDGLPTEERELQRSSIVFKSVRYL